MRQIIWKLTGIPIILLPYATKAMFIALFPLPQINLFYLVLLHDVKVMLHTFCQKSVDISHGMERTHALSCEIYTFPIEQSTGKEAFVIDLVWWVYPISVIETIPKLSRVVGCLAPSIIFVVPEITFIYDHFCIKLYSISIFLCSRILSFKEQIVMLIVHCGVPINWMLWNSFCFDYKISDPGFVQFPALTHSDLLRSHGRSWTYLKVWRWCWNLDKWLFYFHFL